MKLKTLLTLFATVCLGFNIALAAEEDTPLAKEMKAMNKNLRTLKKQIADAGQKDANLKLIADIKKNIAASMKLEPAKTKDVPAAEKAAYIEKYKQEMTELSKTYDEMEVAIKGGKFEDAQKALEKLSDQKEKGHKDFGACE